MLCVLRVPVYVCACPVHGHVNVDVHVCMCICLRCTPTLLVAILVNACAATMPQTFSRDEVAEHCTRDDLWVVIDDRVFDLTSYIEKHPGGDSLLKYAGRDASVGFHGEQHPAHVNATVEQFLIGNAM